MEKSKSLTKMLMIGGVTIALLAPMALSPIANNVMPNTTITVQAKRRHHRHHHHHYHMTKGDKRFFRDTIPGSMHYYHLKWRKIHYLRHAIHHYHGRTRRIIKHRIHRLYHAATWSSHGRHIIRKE